MQYKNYINSHSKSNRIYSRDEVLDMPLRAIRDNKSELEAQYRVIGVPSEEALKASSNVVWVDEYTRADGTKVSGHWRSKPEGGAAVPTGGASEIEVKNIDKILDCGLEKYFGLPAGALLNYRRGIIDYADYPKEIQEKMAYNEILQGVLYEKTAKIKYPISSALLNNAMRNFESAKADKNAEVLHGMNELKPSVRQALKDYGVPENSSGVIYNEESFVSKSFSNSS